MIADITIPPGKYVIEYWFFDSPREDEPRWASESDDSHGPDEAENAAFARPDPAKQDGMSSMVVRPQADERDIRTLSKIEPVDNRRNTEMLDKALRIGRGRL